MLQINIHCHICFGLRLLPKMLKIQTYLAGERLGREGWCGLLKSGPLTQLVKRFIASKERNHNEGKPHSRERKREQPPQRDPDNPKAGALLTSGPVLRGSIPSLAAGCGAGALPWHCSLYGRFPIPTSSEHPRGPPTAPYHPAMRNR